MPNQPNQASKIVLACETENAETLVASVNLALAEKVTNHVETRKKVIGASLIEDYDVTEDVEEEVTHPDDQVSEDTIVVDSTKETGAKKLKNAEAMGDEDVSKRVRYEATAVDVLNAIVEMRRVAFDNGDMTVSISESQANALKSVFDNLNEENQVTMLETLTESRCGFIKMVSWCSQAAK
jgi:hypothetical protein